MIDLATGNPDPTLLPRLDAALRSLDTDPRLYDEPQHLPSLLQFVAAELAGDGVPTGGITLVSGAWTASNACCANICAPATTWRSKILGSRRFTTS